MDVIPEAVLGQVKALTILFIWQLSLFYEELNKIIATFSEKYIFLGFMNYCDLMRITCFALPQKIASIAFRVLFNSALYFS